MAISEDPKTGPNDNYKQMYRNLKRKLKILIQENECFKSELRRTQGQYLQVDRDNNFLLDRLMQHENFESSSSDSDDDTDSTDIENEQSVAVKTEQQPSKRKRASESVSSLETGQPAPSGGKKKRSASASAASSTRNPVVATRNQSKTVKVSSVRDSSSKTASTTNSPVFTNISDQPSPVAGTSSFFTIKNVVAPALNSLPSDDKRTGISCHQLFPESSAAQENNSSFPSL